MGVDCVNFVLNVLEVVPQQPVLDSLRLFASEVMPKFRDVRAKLGDKTVEGTRQSAAAGGR
jgi:hypothetical protein